MGVCDVPVISGVCDSAGEAAASLVTAPFDWLAEAMGNAAAWMFESVWQVFDTTTIVDVTSSQFTKVYNILFGVAVFVMLGFFMLQVIGGMVRREPAALTRAALGLAKSILGSFVALTLLAAALEITDQLCIGIVHAAGTNMEQMGDRIALLAAGLTSLNIAAPGAGAIITIFIAGLAIGAAVIVWISLLVRKALLLIAIVFAPIAFAGSSWDHTRTWVSKWASFVVALIVSKVVLVVIFLLATAQVSAPIDADLQSVSEPIAGRRAHAHRRLRAVPDLQGDQLHGLRHVPRDVGRAGGQDRAQPSAADPHGRPRRCPAEEGLGRRPTARAAAGSGRSAAPPPAPTASGGRRSVRGGRRPVGRRPAGRPRVPRPPAAASPRLPWPRRRLRLPGPKLGGYVGSVAAQHSDGANGSQPDPSLPLPQVADPALAAAGTRKRGER